MGNQNSHHNGKLPPEPNILKKSSSKSKIVVPENVSVLCQLLTEHSKEDNVGTNISKRAFLKYFSTSRGEFAEILFDHYAFGRHLGNDWISSDTFLKVSEDILELRSDAQQLKYCLGVFSIGKDSLDTSDVRRLFYNCYILASEVSNCKVIDSFNTELLLNAVVTSAMKGNKTINEEALNSWIRKNCLHILFGVHHWVSYRLLNVELCSREIEAEDNSPLKTPLLSEDSSAVDAVLSPMLLWLLTCTLPTIYTKPNHSKPSFQRMLSGHLDPHTFIARLLNCFNPSRWTSLYNSREHGLSFNRLQNHVFSYRGPTVVVVSAEENMLFCAAVDQEWRESTHHWGGENSIIIQITPEYKILEEGAKLFFFNLNTRGLPFGLQIGLNTKIPSLEVDKDMSVLYFKKIPYRLLTFEAWGCAGEEAKDAQVKQKRWENEEAEKQRKINLNAVDWKDHPDKYLLELAGTQRSYSHDSNR